MRIQRARKLKERNVDTLEKNQYESGQVKSLITDFTTGNVPKQLAVFAAPLFLSNLMQVVYNMVDMLIVGQCVGSVGLSAISVGGDIASFMTFLAMGFSNAGQVIISQFIGAKKESCISKFVGTMVTFLLRCAAMISVIVMIARHQILGWMNTPVEAWNYALDYITICTVGLIFIYGYNIVSAVLRGFGDSRHPFIFISIASVMNVVLDILFVMGFGWGAAGAAFATVLSQTVSFLLAAGFIFKNRSRMNLEFSVEYFKIDKRYLSTLVKLGIPMAIKNASVQFSKLFVNSWINSYGVVVSAVSGIGNKLSTIANLFSNSVNTAGASMVGQNIGAEKFKRVSKVMLSAFVIDITIMGVIIAIFVSFPEFIFGLFTSDTSIMPVAMEFVFAGVLMFLGSAFRAPMNTLLNGGGNYKMNFAVAVLDGMINRIGFSLLLGLVFHMEYQGFWIGDALASFTPFFIGGAYYLSGKWKTRKYVIKD